MTYRGTSSAPLTERKRLTVAAPVNTNTYSTDILLESFFQEQSLTTSLYEFLSEFIRIKGVDILGPVLLYPDSTLGMKNLFC